MSLFNKTLSNVTIDDIKELVANGVGESRTLDYKLELHSNADSGKKELLKDLSAFANTVGGCLIYGVNEEGGLPTEIVGVKVDDFDKFKLHYENLLRTGVDPAIRGVEFHNIAIDSEKCIVIIEVPKSIARPHAVIIKKHFKFYSRNSSGVHQLEVDDLRRAFLASETLATRIRTFRKDRLSAITTDETFMRLCPGGKIVLHIIPVSSFELGKRYDFVDGGWYSDFPPIFDSGQSRRITFDGVMTYTYSSDHATRCDYYTHVFNNGVLEAVDAHSPNVNGKQIPLCELERELVKALDEYLTSFEKYKVELPVWICLSLLNVRGHENYIAPHCRPVRCSRPIDRDELIVPEIKLESYKSPANQILKPAFDLIWNACGYKQSLNYDENGNWNEG